MWLWTMWLPSAWVIPEEGWQLRTVSWPLPQQWGKSDLQSWIEGLGNAAEHCQHQVKNLRATRTKTGWKSETVLWVVKNQVRARSQETGVKNGWTPPHPHPPAKKKRWVNHWAAGFQDRIRISLGSSISSSNSPNNHLSQTFAKWSSWVKAKV